MSGDPGSGKWSVFWTAVGSIAALATVAWAIFEFVV